jgi:hypothetical protein
MNKRDGSAAVPFAHDKRESEDKWAKYFMDDTKISF